jgi:epoxide hydrolase-like predicted phosphatase
MIRAVIFDVGGVLLRTEDRTSRANLETRLGLAPGQADTIVFNSLVGQQAQRGEITTAALWRWVQQELHLSDADLQRFQTEFWGGDQVDHALIDFIRTLRSRYQTAIISNASDNLNEVIARLDPEGSAFELIVGSAYEKVMKPDPRIFERTLARLGRQPDEAVFIDDFMHNIVGAQAVGMHGIHFTPGIDLPAALTQLGVVV